MIFLLLLLFARADAVLTRYAVSFEDTLYVDRLKNATFCAVVNDTLQGTIQCDSFQAFQIDRVLMSVVQFNMDTPVDVYNDGNVTEQLNLALHNAGFFTLDESLVLQITDIYRPFALFITTQVVFSICMIILGAFPLLLPP